jgi:hypothetical protein
MPATIVSDLVCRDWVSRNCSRWARFMGSPPCTGFKSLSLQIIPVDGLRRPTIRFGVEIGFRRVGQAESATLDFANVFACRAGDEAVELSLNHLH